MRKNYIILLFTLISLQTFSQIAFYKIFTNNGYDYGQGAVQLEDSSYVICGSSSSFEEGASQAFLLKIDSLGNYLWSTHYGGIESEWGRRVLYKKDFGFYIAGYTNSFGYGGYDFYLVKTNENGGFEWEKTYGGSNWEKINDAVLTRDTGTLLVGQTNSTVNGTNDIYIVKTKINGDTLWTRKIGANGDDAANSIKQFNDSTFIIAGEIYVEDSLMTKGFIMSLRDDGTINWIDTLGNNGDYGINDIDIDFNLNNINFVGWSLNTNINEKNTFFGRVKTSGVFDFEIADTYPETRVLEFITGYGQLGKNYIAYDFVDIANPAEGINIAIARFGQDLWGEASFMLISNPYDDVVGQLIPTSDGGALSVGYMSSFGAGGGNVFVAKIGPNDLYPNTSGVPVSNPIVNILEIQNDYGIKIYPNPTSDVLILSTSYQNQIIFEVRGIDGNILMKDELYSEKVLLIDQLSAGIYFITFFNENKDKIDTRRIVKL